MNRISYILPVFGSEEHIAECLESVYLQDIPEYEFEVICVDDCSLDHSRDIIKQYQKEHNNLFLVEHNNNKKAGGARNTGIMIAKGEYVWFVDSDDMIPPFATSQILSVCGRQNLDVLCFNYSIISNNRKEKDCLIKEEIQETKGLAFIETFFGDDLIFNLGYPWRAVYRRRLLLDAHIRFVDNMPYGEETTFMMQAITNAERVAAIPEAFYCYRQTDKQVSAHLREGKGDIIFYSTIGAGEMIVRWRDEVAEKSMAIAESLDQGLPWFVNRLFIRLIKTSHKQRVAFYSLAKKTPPSESLRHYMNLQNRFAVKHPLLGLGFLDLLSVAYRIKHA